jgi:hypothetical protein
VLRYDMNIQHFQGSGGEADGRIRIRMNPEVIPDGITPQQPSQDPPASPADGEPEASG